MDPLVNALLAALDRGGSYAIAATFIILWWLERKERIDAYTELKEIARRATDALNNAANALGDLRVYLGLNRHERRDEK